MRNVIFLLLVFFLLAGCSGAPAVVPTATALAAPAVKSQGGSYPGPAAGENGPTPAGYPAPDSVQPAVDTTDPQLGTVTGVVTVKGIPADGILYLAAMIKDANEKETIAGLNPSKSPLAVPELNGRFTFTNVKPGRYAVVFDNTSQSFLLTNPKNAQEPLIVVVDSNKPVDLGKLDYTQLPPK